MNNFGTLLLKCFLLLSTLVIQQTVSVNNYIATLVFNPNIIYQLYKNHEIHKYDDFVQHISFSGAIENSKSVFSLKIDKVVILKLNFLDSYIIVNDFMKKVEKHFENETVHSMPEILDEDFLDVLQKEASSLLIEQFIETSSDSIFELVVHLIEHLLFFHADILYVMTAVFNRYIFLHELPTIHQRKLIYNDFFAPLIRRNARFCFLKSFKSIVVKEVCSDNSSKYELLRQKEIFKVKIMSIEGNFIDDALVYMSLANEMILYYLFNADDDKHFTFAKRIKFIVEFYKTVDQSNVLAEHANKLNSLIKDNLLHDHVEDDQIKMLKELFLDNLN